MRPVLRAALGARPARWLNDQTGNLAANSEVLARAAWTARRSTMNRNGILSALESMAGLRSRCMYCGDSEACDIEHYRPKSPVQWRSFVFDWGNLLWICQPCNRLKGDKFPLAPDSSPLLLDPAVDRVWDYFCFVPETGYLVAREDVDPALQARAEATLSEDITRLVFQLILDERRRTYRQLRRAISSYVASQLSAQDEEELLVACVDAGYPELCEWFLALDGSADSPFREFVLASPGVVEEIRVRLNQHFPGVW